MAGQHGCRGRRPLRMKGIKAEVGRSHMSGRPWRGLQMTSLVQLRTGHRRLLRHLKPESLLSF